MVARSMNQRESSNEPFPSLDDIGETIRRILRERLRLSPESVGKLNWDTPLLGRGIGLDSIEAMTLVTALEQEFAVEFHDDELNPSLFASLESLAGAVAGKLKAVHPPEG
ncbi:MAG: hypothetical protein Kow00109_20440 [Acidobacteriota bacterium]